MKSRETSTLTKLAAVTTAESVHTAESDAALAAVNLLQLVPVIVGSLPEAGETEIRLIRLGVQQLMEAFDNLPPQQQTQQL